MSSSVAHSARGRRGGFTLIEVMAAVLLLAISLVLMLKLRNDALGRASDGRALSVASRLGLGLLRQIEAARVSELYDGYTGDFSDEGFPDFYYSIGVGDDSALAGGAAQDEDELIWRQAKIQRAEDKAAESDEDEDEEKPPYTRIFIDVSYPSSRGERKSYFLETLLPTWAVYQDFELYREMWPNNFPKELE